MNYKTIGNKTMNPLVILMIIFSVTAMGCGGMDASKKEDPDSNLSVAIVDDPQLAKLILKPQQRSISVSRDPFKPLYEWSSKRADAKTIEPVKQQFNNLNFIGMIKMGEQAVALFKAGDKRLMLKTNGQYKGFILTEISSAQVIFSDGATQITLKRGTKK